MNSQKPLFDPRAVFEIFQDKAGRWCARRLDGLVFGLFIERDAAVRFCRRESQRPAQAG